MPWHVKWSTYSYLCTCKIYYSQGLHETHKYLFNSFDPKPYFEEKELSINLETTYSTSVAEEADKGDPRGEHLVETKFEYLTAPTYLGMWKVVSRHEVLPNSNFDSRYVQANKDGETKDEIWKADFVVQGHLGILKTLLVHKSATVHQYSVKMLIALASALMFRIFSTIVTQA